MKRIYSKVLFVGALSLLLTACGSSDDPPVVNAGADFSLKERRSAALSATTDAGSDATIVWNQVSGPQLTFSATNTLSPQVTAPSVDTNGTALLRLSVTNGKGKTTTDDLSVTIINNTLPQITADFAAVAEKSEVQLTATIVDDGEVTAVSWQQTAGPELELSGTDSATVSFVAPAITENVSLTFLISATDDDNESAELETTLTIEANWLMQSLSGQVVGADFSGAAVSVSGAAEPVTATVSNSGDFLVEFAIDDDLLDNVLTLNVTAADNPRLSYSALYTGFSVPEPVTGAGVAALPAIQDTVRSDSNQVTVSAVSTALYALLVTANSGAVPANVEQLVYYEKSIDPNALTEAAAVVKILTDNPDIALPAGTDNLVDLLTNIAAYNTVITQIETAQPGLVAATVTDIINDPVLTPPVTPDQLPELYFRTYATAPGFLSRNGERWQFSSNGQGHRATNIASSAFNWQLDNGKINIEYDGSFYSTSFPAARAGLAGLTQQQVDWLAADGIYQIEIRNITQSGVLTRLTTGQAIDTYQLDTVNNQVLASPIQTSSGLITTAGQLFESSTNVLLRKVNDNLTFSAAALPGIWALNSFYTLQFTSGDVANFYLDPLQFNANGTGVGLDTERSFNWQVTDGLLAVSFADGTALQVQILDQLDDNLQVFSTVTDSASNIIAAQADYAFKIPGNASFANTEFIVPQGKYWQTTVNQWQLPYWDSGRLLFCYADPDCRDEYPTTGYYGWQFDAGNIGTRAISYQGLPPDFTPVFSPQFDSLSWTLTDDATLSFLHNQCWFDSEQLCTNRQWQLLKVTPGLLGTRIYVIEEQFTRVSAEADFNLYSPGLGTRLNIYELLDYDYWNNTAPTVNSINVTTGLQPFGVVTPSRKVIQPAQYHAAGQQ